MEANLSLCKGISSLAHFLLWLLRGADLFLSLDFEFGYCNCVAVPSSPLLSVD